MKKGNIYLYLLFLIVFLFGIVFLMERGINTLRSKILGKETLPAVSKNYAFYSEFDIYPKRIDIFVTNLNNVSFDPDCVNLYYNKELKRNIIKEILNDDGNKKWDENEMLYIQLNERGSYESELVLDICGYNYTVFNNTR